jgi:hypothetical protein
VFSAGGGRPGITEHSPIAARLSPAGPDPGDTPAAFLAEAAPGLIRGHHREPARPGCQGFFSSCSS